MEPFKKHLSRDPKLRPLLKHTVTLPPLQKNMAFKLVASILSQQLSIKVAQVMTNRFLEIYSGKKPNALQILNTPRERIRQIGISHKKAEYIHNVAQFFYDHKLTDKKLQKMSNDEIIELLIQIKGVGRWTVEMLLIFGLGREDVFAVDDLGIQKGIQKNYKLEHLKGRELREKMINISEKWSPYRSYACLYLWKSLE